MSLQFSVVIPVYNEEMNIPHLIDRTIGALNKLEKTYEIIFTNDGSQDKSLTLLTAYQKCYPEIIKIIDFKYNFGQHMAIIAGFEHASGETIITLDADLQNPPEEIYKLLQKIDEGYDYVGSYRDKRQDSLLRTIPSKIINWIREKSTNIKMRDQGCMLRAYSKVIIKKIAEGKEHSTYIPALAYKLSQNPTEVEVVHASRAAGESKYNFYSLIRLNFDLITSFTIAPLQLFTAFGLGVCLLSGVLVLYLVIRRFVVGPEAEGIFTLFAIAFFLMSFIILGIGLIGEYVGRLSQNLSPRPRFEIRERIGFDEKKSQKPKKKKAAQEENPA